MADIGPIIRPDNVKIATVSVVTELVRAFNINTTPQVDPGKSNPYDGKINQTKNIDKALYNSPLGTPIVTNLVFQSVKWTNFINNQTFTTPTITLDTVLINVSLTKNIVKTQIIGLSGGTIKEYIGEDDYTVQINGIIVSPQPGHYPASDVRQLKLLLNAPVPIPITCAYLQNLDIHTLVVNDYSFAQEPGGWSKQAFTINCITDTPFELKVVSGF